MLAFLPNLGLPELLVIGAVALLIFGSRLPSTMRSLGKSVVEFKKGLREGETEEDAEDPEKKDKAKGDGDGDGAAKKPVEAKGEPTK
jgi:sec-independent protein translocase protein TatA